MSHHKVYLHNGKWLTRQRWHQLGVSVKNLDFKEVSFYVRQQTRGDTPHKKYVKSDQTKVDKNRDRYLKSKYNISLEDYNKMVVIQKGLCAICGRPPKETENFDVDHSHTTNIVRELLCNFCNTNLSTFELYPEQTIAYGKRHNMIKDMNV